MYINENDGSQYLKNALELLAANNLPAADEMLVKARNCANTLLAAHNAIEQNQLPSSMGAWTGVNAVISEKDDIFHFFASHPTSINPLRDYLADGWRTMSELVLLLESVNRPLSHFKNMLEFASGHGRFTRHLVKVMGQQLLTVSDVVQDACEFSSQNFGVKTFTSSLMPEGVKFPQSYDLIFVLSLFSHLPKSNWGRWLAKLYAGLEAGGILIFTTHGDFAAKRQGVTLDENGFFFAPSSESNAIEAQNYGTTFTNDAFVKKAIHEYLPDASLLKREKQCFWAHQDAWVITKPLLA